MTWDTVGHRRMVRETFEFGPFPSLPLSPGLIDFRNGTTAPFTPILRVRRGGGVKDHTLILPSGMSFPCRGSSGVHTLATIVPV